MNQLTIYSVRTGEPLAILGQEEGAPISVVGGDPSAIKQFRLDRFDTLDDVASYANQSSTIRAVPDEQQGGEPGDEPEQQAQPQQPPVDDRVGPALKIIADLMARVEANRKRKAEQDAAEQAAVLEQQSAQAVEPLPEHIYVSIDGDNIGNAVARAEETDDEQTLKEISDRINAGQAAFKAWAEGFGGTVIEQGGDEGVAKVPKAAMENIEQLRQQYQTVVGATASVGVGSRISESTKARELAKLRGKDQTVLFDKGTEQELQMRLEQEGDQGEADKIKSAGLGGPRKDPEPEQDQTQPVEQQDRPVQGGNGVDSPIEGDIHPDVVEEANRQGMDPKWLDEFIKQF